MSSAIVPFRQRIFNAHILHTHLTVECETSWVFSNYWCMYIHIKSLPGYLLVIYKEHYTLEAFNNGVYHVVRNARIFDLFVKELDSLTRELDTSLSLTDSTNSCHRHNKRMITRPEHMLWD